MEYIGERKRKGMIESAMSFSDFIAHLQTLRDDHDAAVAYAESYVAAHAGSFPIAEGNTAHFVYQDRPNLVAGVAGEWNGFDGRGALMLPIGGGLVHYQ